MKFEIGQEVWWARFDTVESSIECPDCVGKRHIRCIMGDGTEVTVDCQNCNVGYEAFSRGRIKTYDRAPRAEKTVISGWSGTATKTEYRVRGSYLVPEDQLFESEESAMIMAEMLAVAASAEELERIGRKEKDTKSWAWNASYHRKCIRDANRIIEYHTRKLDVAGEKARAQRERKAK